ncbi:ABC transporter permease [Microbacterium sp. C7(2022)]|uniref:ABC transporter permease n=1 Tax=Microbacterium sp. C7(2022) TaxID=2992759 RepID=UPI00237B2E00|nr:ABC transporter permease [Microbacterium sp. C7(2022)]MDE0545808.1 ABC transporter permease [Microbacterium sp. C7(2022)]
MYGTYLRRELAGRKKQTAIVAAGLAVAIALVIIVNSLSAGVKDAQAQALESVYGVGTDLTVTGATAEPGEGGGPRFEFDDEAGETTDGTTSISQSRLSADFLRGTLSSSVVDSVAATDGVAATSAALSLTNTTFSGEMPDRSQMQQGEPGEGQAPPTGGPDGAGGSAFDLDSFTVLGVDTTTTAVGPLSAVEVTDGRLLDASDAGQLVAVVDATYASTAELSVGDSIDVGGSTVEVVGIVGSTSNEADTAANVYLPLDSAQNLAGLEDAVSTIYVQAESADQIATVQQAIQDEVPDATVSSQSDLASTVSGSLSSASALITNLGTWLSIIVLAVALVLAVLFTISGVSRRTREFGTLKAIGWSNSRVVGQVAGESAAQGLIGGALGLLLGVVGIVLINALAPTISVAQTASEMPAGPGGQSGPGGGAFGQALAESSSDIVLSAPFTPAVIVLAIGIAVAGGALAGVFGGWRAARLSPAEALRSVG